MTLNGTLIVQLINFGIAYFLIDRLLLRKAVFLIQQEQFEQESLMKNMQQGRDKFHDGEIQKKLEWERFRQRFKEKSLRIIKRSYPKIVKQTVVQSAKLSNSEKNLLIDELKNALIKKVIHGSN